MPIWPIPSGSGLDQLTGDVTAGPGTGSQVATLVNSTNVKSIIASNAAATLRLIYVDDLAGVDPTGVTDSSAAIIAEQTSLGTNPYILILGQGTYRLNNPLNTFTAKQGMQGVSSSLTNLTFYGTGTCVNISDGASFGSSSNAGPHSGYNIDMSNATAGSIGFAFGAMTMARNTDISVSNSDGVGSIGFHLINPTNTWSEQGVWIGIRSINNTNGYVLDYGSHDYNSYDFLCVANANQNGLVMQNNASCVGSIIKFVGNFATGVGSNTGVGWVIGTSTTDVSTMIQCTFQVSCEADGTGVAHKSFNISQTGNNHSLVGHGVWVWNGGSATFVNGTNAGGIIGIAGYVSEPGLGLLNLNGDAASFLGGVGFKESGNLLTSYAYNNMLIYCQFGPYHSFIMPNSVVAISGFQGINFLREVNIFFNSGGASSAVTWPANVKFSGSSVLSTTAGYIDRVHLIYLPSSGNWYGEVHLHYA